MKREPVIIEKRKRIPLSIRYEVLKRQCPHDKVEEIEAKGGNLKTRYAKLLCHAVCAMTGDKLIEKGCEFDHRIPRALGGSSAPGNLRALTPAAHRRKTDQDDADIARADRRKLYDETGRSSAKKYVKKIPQPTPEQRKAQYQRAKAMKAKIEAERRE